ncbi:hypothetical protein [Geodermatophilus sp. SYSU D01119]
MVWVVVSVVGFVVVTGVVTAIARSNTARWERDHRAPQAAIRAHERAIRHGWLTTLAHWQENGDTATDRRPHLHLPHVHLPAGLVARLPHPHVPALHLPRVHLPHVHLPGRGRAGGAPGTQPPEPPAPAGADDRTGVSS